MLCCMVTVVTFKLFNSSRIGDGGTNCFENNRVSKKRKKYLLLFIFLEKMQTITSTISYAVDIYLTKLNMFCCLVFVWKF